MTNHDLWHGNVLGREIEACHHRDNPIDNRVRNRPPWVSADETRCFVKIYHEAVAESVFAVIDEVRENIA